jgi:hypothetical protein
LGRIVHIAYGADGIYLFTSQNAEGGHIALINKRDADPQWQAEPKLGEFALGLPLQQGQRHAMLAFVAHREIKLAFYVEGTLISHPAHHGRPAALGSLSAGRFLISMGRETDRTIQLWSIDPPQRLSTTRMLGDRAGAPPTARIAVSRDNDRILVTGTDGIITIWRPGP